MTDVLYFPIVEVLEAIHLFDAEAHFEVVEEDELEPGVHAVTDILTKTIKIRCDVYDGACDGCGRDRMTLAHEFAHFITLSVCGFKQNRSFSDDKIPAYCDPEWQAKCMAGELMIDSDFVKGMSAEEVSKTCGVSLAAARMQLSKIA